VVLLRFTIIYELMFTPVFWYRSSKYGATFIFYSFHGAGRLFLRQIMDLIRSDTLGMIHYYIVFPFWGKKRLKKSNWTDQPSWLDFFLNKIFIHFLTTQTEWSLKIESWGVRSYHYEQVKRGLHIFGKKLGDLFC